LARATNWTLALLRVMEKITMRPISLLAVLVVVTGCDLPMVSQLNSPKDPANGGTANGVSASLPSAPTGVLVTPGNSQVSIQWNSVSGATSYNVYWSKNAGFSPSTGTKISGAVSPFTQTGLSNGTQYYWIVTAVSASGETSSGQATATPGLSVPPAPTGLVGSGILGQALSWTPSSGATSYNVYWSSVPIVQQTSVNRLSVANTSPVIVTALYPGCASTAVPVSGLVPGNTYYWVVTAVNPNGESGPSNEFNGIFGTELVSNLSVASGNSSLTVSWTNPQYASQMNIQNYNVYWSTSQNATISTASVAPSVGSGYIITGLSAGTTYYVFVVGLQGTNYTAPSITVSGSPTANATGALTVSNPAIVTITLSGQTTTLPVGTAMTVTATPSVAVDSYAWYMDGSLLSGAATNTYSGGSTLATGPHELVVVVSKNGVLYSNNCFFTVQ